MRPRTPPPPRLRGGLVASVVAVLAVVLCAIAPRAYAAGTPQIQLQTDVDTVGVGDVVHLVMTVQSGEGAPSDPQLPSVPGLQLRGQNASPSQTHISINGNRMDRWGLTVDFALQAQRVGTYRLAPTVSVGAARFTTTPVSVRVVAAGQAPRPPPQQQPTSPFGFSPFDPWKNLFPQFDQQPDNQSAPEPPQVNIDPRLSLDAPRGAIYFLHATVDKTSAVVGEAVTFSVYEYLDAVSVSGLEIDDSDVHDATADDFVKRPLRREDEDAQLMGFASVGGRTWQVKLVRRWALFPLHAGDLTIGPMVVPVTRPRAAAGKRTTETLTVHVTEPPVAGRPPGYALGDVGRFSLGAQVTPRDVEQGGAVGVHLELSGTGNVPAALTPPARDGIEWLAPETHEQLGPVGHEAFGGKRTFDYVVRLLRPGDVDLGEIALPFWDGAQKRYDVARASLGVVHVKPSAAGAAAASAQREQEKLQGLPEARDALEGDAPHRAHPDDSRLFWLAGIGGWPSALGLAVAGSAITRRVRRRWSLRKASPATELKERVAGAIAACQGSDPRAVDAAIARALQAAAVAHCGVSVRGAVGVQVVERLEDAGATSDTAAQIAELLRQCEEARFSPDAADVQAARDRWAQARAAIRALEAGA
jgi:hypothetical protein